MQTFVMRVAAVALPGALLVAWSAAQAQLGNLLNPAGNGSSAGTSGNASGGPAGALGNLGNLGGLGGALPGGASLSSGSAGNVTGLLQYCIQNNYLSASSAGSVKVTGRRKVRPFLPIGERGPPHARHANGYRRA